MAKIKDIAKQALKKVGVSPAEMALPQLQGVSADMLVIDDPSEIRPLTIRTGIPSMYPDGISGGVGGGGCGFSTVTVGAGATGGGSGGIAHTIMEQASLMGLTREQIENLMPRQTAAQLQAEEKFRRERLDRHHPREFNINIDIADNVMDRTVLMRARMRVDVGNTTEIPERVVADVRERDDWIRAQVNATVEDVARRTERELYDQMVMAFRALDERGRGNRRAEAWYGAREWMNHGGDVMRGIMESHVAADIKGQFSWAKDFVHTDFELHGWTAKCLTTAEAVREEGSTMEHCLGKSYIVRISEGNYMAYHIQPPPEQGYPRSGFTLGLRRVGQIHPWRIDQIKGKRNQTHYNEDTGLNSIADMIVSMLN